MGAGLQQTVTGLLDQLIEEGGYGSALVCTDDGLVIASSGAVSEDEHTAAFTSLFDEVVRRARRDLDFRAVDEVTLLDPGRGRTVIRPLNLEGEQQLFLVVRLPTNKTWRRNTNKLCSELRPILQPLLSGEVF